MSNNLLWANLVFLDDYLKNISKNSAWLNNFETRDVATLVLSQLILSGYNQAIHPVVEKLLSSFCPTLFTSIIGAITSIWAAVPIIAGGMTFNAVFTIVGVCTARAIYPVTTSTLFIVCVLSLPLQAMEWRQMQCFYCSWNIGQVTLKIDYFHYLKIPFLDQSIPKKNSFEYRSTGQMMGTGAGFGQ